MDELTDDIQPGSNSRSCVVHVVPHIHRQSEGPSHSVPRLCQELNRRRGDVSLVCLEPGASVDGVHVKVFPQWGIVQRFAIAPELALSLRRRADSVAVVHNHSLWSMVNVAAGWVVPGRRAKLVVSPRGTLSEWALNHSKHIKRIVWPFQRRALERADLLHATCEAEYGDIRRLGFSAPVAIIPNGVDAPPAGLEPERSRLRTLLFLSRIHPTKGVDRLLRIWSDVQDRHTDWRLVIAGGGRRDYEKSIRGLAEGLQVDRVEFPGPLFDSAKSRAYMSADLFILPTHSENFGIVVAEALAHGCPTITTKSAPWSGLERQGCGWWVDDDVDALRRTMDEAMSLPRDQLVEMGSRGSTWMEREFSWPIIGEEMNAVYSWLTSSGDRPDCVRTI